MIELLEDMALKTDESALLTVKEVAQAIGVSVNTIRRWSDRGIVRGYRISERGDRRFSRESIARFIADLHANHGDERKAGLTH